MHGGFIAPNINFENPDEHSARINIAATRLDLGFDTFLSNSFGFGGTNSSLVLQRFKG
jgi:3-oxoacyl-[acyl-carrier-protein] synthase-1